MKIEFFGKSPFDEQETIRLLKHGKKPWEPSVIYYIRKKYFIKHKSVADAAEIWFYEKWLTVQSPKSIPIRGNKDGFNSLWGLLYENYLSDFCLHNIFRPKIIWR